VKRNIVVEKSFDFAVNIVGVCRSLERKREFVLARQLLKSGTSIGANVNEAIQGQSRADFIAKMNIALKEAQETEYWLKLLKETKTIEEQEYKELNDECQAIKKILSSIILSTRENNEKK
jgi:four helix bundle protein